MKRQTAGSLKKLPALLIWKRPPMKSSRSNTEIPIVTRIFFEASCYDISANVYGLADNSGDDSVCLERHSTLENLTSGMYIFCLVVNRVNGKCQVMI
jgi:hypothetical protein